MASDVAEDARAARANSHGALDAVYALREVVLQRFDDLQVLIEGSPKDLALREAVKNHSRDMHHPSDRPCSTCQAITNALGEPFGCIEFDRQLRLARVKKP